VPPTTLEVNVCVVLTGTPAADAAKIVAAVHRVDRAQRQALADSLNHTPATSSGAEPERSSGYHHHPERHMLQITATKYSPNNTHQITKRPAITRVFQVLLIRQFRYERPN